MVSFSQRKYFFIVFVGSLVFHQAHAVLDDFDIVSEEEFQINQNAPVTQTQNTTSDEEDTVSLDDNRELYIREIQVIGNKNIPTEAVLYAIPYRVGQLFSPIRSGQLIRNIYKYFKDVRLWVKQVDPEGVKLIIVVEEDPKINSISYKGNKHLRADEVEKKGILTDLRTANIQRLDRAARQIKKLYADKNYHEAVVIPRIHLTPRGTADVVFEIDEGDVSLIKRVFFEGNHNVSSKKLRSLLFTREDWIFGAMDKSGTYQPDAIEMDKHSIESFYQGSGYLTARVTDVKIDKEPVTNNLTVTFVIDEGELFVIDEVSIEGNDLISEPELLRRVGIYPGQLYSKERIRAAMESLRMIWGQFGFANAEVLPHLTPDFERNTVSISFENNLGTKVFLNNIWIIGNYKTRDHVIRRQLTLREGDLLTVKDMDRSKLKVEGLGYFDVRDGVNWRVKHLDDDLADLELWVKEVKTGKFYATLGFGGSLKDLTAPGDALKFELTASDLNILGTGMSGYISATAAADEQSLTLNLTEPYLFDRPILGATDTFYKHSRYDEIKSLITVPKERLAGSSIMLGYTSHKMYDTRFIAQSGFESIRYQDKIIVAADVPSPELREVLATVLTRRFQPGNLVTVSATALQDFRANPTHPNRGYQWSLTHKVGVPVLADCFGFYKFEADATYYTPLIGEYDLVFMWHGHLGLLTPILGKNVPYRELFHIGGPATVRGFLFGEIGPQLDGNSIGGTKTFFVNTELIFPITRDLSIKGAVFYDGGAGWDTLNADNIPAKFLRNNRFDYRHAIGIGLRMLQPTPIRIDWGFKLDKRKNEKEFEVSFTALREF